MNHPQMRILFIDDDEEDFILTRDLFSEIQGGKYHLEWVGSYEAGLKAVLEKRHDVYFVDYHLGPRNGLELLREALAQGCKVPVILLTGRGDQEVAVEAMKAGAADYLVKGQVAAPLLERSIRHALERAQTLEALRESEDRFRDLFENASDLISVAAPDGSLLYVNRVWREALGYSPEVVPGLSILNVVHPDYKADYREARRRVLAGEKLDRLETHFLTMDGRTLVMEGGLTCRFEGGVPVSTRGIFRDVTERKRAETELKMAKEAAEAANRAKSDLLAHFSHQVRMPLTGILGMTELTLNTPLTPEQREYLGLVKESADSLLTVIGDILDFSKIEAGEFHLDATDFNLEDHLMNTLKPLILQVHQKGVELRFRVQPKVPASVIGDPWRLRQIILILVGNAVKFTEAGEVGVYVEVESKTQGEVCLHFAVRDTGIGIAPEDQELLFEAFKKTDTSLTRRYQGTGLGLAIASRLVKLMGGRMWLESEVGQGSKFHFTANFGLAARPAGPPLLAGPVNLRGLPVLVVDDDPAYRRALEEILNLWHMKPTMAASAMFALALLESAKDAGEPLPLLLLDAQMPKMDGFTLAHRIKQNPDLAGTAIVILSSDEEKALEARCRELGINAFLRKPFKQGELLASILKALRLSSRHEDQPSTVHVVAPGGRRKLHILLAEDNAVNQKLAVHILEKEGHSVVPTGNGKQALAALAKEPFDLVFMDVQMPEMNGLEATAAIRATERAAGRHTPIIALTGFAMKGDRERCLEAGMDSYVSKPFKVQELQQAIERVLVNIAPPEVRAKGPGAGEKAPKETVPPPSQGGNGEILRENVGLFFDEGLRLVKDIQEAVGRGDARQLERAAHRLKGLVEQFAAQAATEAALRLERMGHTGDLSDAPRAMVKLEQEIRALQSALAGPAHENRKRIT